MTPPKLPPTEQALIRRAAETTPELTFDALDHPALARLSQAYGIDLATALFYHRIRNSPVHGSFIHHVDTLQPAPLPASASRATLLVAPAACYLEHPEFGGDGRQVRAVAGELGLPNQLIPTPSLGWMHENAALIRRRLEEEDGPVILVSLSKGGADVRLALESFVGKSHPVKAWVQLCGLVRGTPAVNNLLAARGPRRWLLNLVLRRFGLNRPWFTELAHGPGTLLGGPVRLPENLVVINVLGCPLRRHITGVVKRRHRELAPFGPNDGSALLRDAILEPGLVYPVWGADHYFRVPHAGALIRRLLCYLGETGVLGC